MQTTVVVTSWAFRWAFRNEVEHTIEVETTDSSIRIKGSILTHNMPIDGQPDQEMIDFDLTFNVGDEIWGRPYDRGGWRGRILRIGKNKITLEGNHDRNQHINFEDFILRNYMRDQA